MTPSTPKTLPELPEPDTTWYGSFSSDRVKFHSTDQIYEFAAARVKAALAAQPPAATPVEWSVQILQDWDPRRLRLTIGVQSFDLDIHDEPDEPGRMEWHCAQLTGAMEKLTSQLPAVAAIPEPSDNEVDLLLAEIDQIARNYDHHDYGLPTCDGDSVASMRAQVQWFFESWTRVPQPPAGQDEA